MKMLMLRGINGKSMLVPMEDITLVTEHRREWDTGAVTNCQIFSRGVKEIIYVIEDIKIIKTMIEARNQE